MTSKNNFKLSYMINFPNFFKSQKNESHSCYPLEDWKVFGLKVFLLLVGMHRFVCLRSKFHSRNIFVSAICQIFLFHFWLSSYRCLFYFIECLKDQKEFTTKQRKCLNLVLPSILFLPPPSNRLHQRVKILLADPQRQSCMA